MGLNFAYSLGGGKSASTITVVSDRTTSARKKAGTKTAVTSIEPLPGQIHHSVRRYGSKLLKHGSKSNERKNRFKQTNETQQETNMDLNDPYLEPPQNQKPHHRHTGSNDDTKKLG